MPPKPIKKELADDPGYLAMRAFKKAYDGANTELGTEPLALPLEIGEEHTCFARLCFWSVDVRDDGALSLASYLMVNKNLRVLEITDCGLGSSACKALGDALSTKSGPKELHTLRLDYNRGIRNAGAAAIMPVSGILSVKELSLSFCGLEGEAGGAVLANGLLSKPMLTHLHINGNPLGSAGIMHVLAGITTSLLLSHINISDTSTTFEPELVWQLTNVLQRCEHVQEYLMSGNLMGDMVGYTLLRQIRELPHIIQFEVSDGIDPILYQQLGDLVNIHRKEWQKRCKKKGGKSKGRPKGKKKK